MTNADAVKKVEAAIANDGLFVYRINGISPGDIKQGDHPDVPAGKYRVVEVSIAIPVED